MVSIFLSQKNLIQSTESLDENTNEINNTESDEIESKEEEEKKGRRIITNK